MNFASCGTFKSPHMLLWPGPFYWSCPFFICELLGFVLFFCAFGKCFCVVLKRCARGEKKKSRERSSSHLNEFAGHQWFIVERGKKGAKGERPHFKAFLLFPKWGWKSAAWLSPNKWLLLPFHGAQRPNPRTTWATNVDGHWDHRSMCQTLLGTHKTHWLQLYEVKMAQKGKMWRRCPQSFLPKKRLQHLGI